METPTSNYTGEITEETSIEDIINSIENSTQKKPKKRKRNKKNKNGKQGQVANPPKDGEEAKVLQSLNNLQEQRTISLSTVAPLEGEEKKEDIGCNLLEDIKLNSPTKISQRNSINHKPAQSVEFTKEETEEEDKKEENDEHKEEEEDEEKDTDKDKFPKSFWEAYNSKDTEGSDNESIEDYKEGGYHPVSLGEVFNNRYKVLKKLGFGAFSTVWFCHDMSQNKFVAIKVQKSGESYYSAAEDEIEILDVISEKIRTEEWKESIQEYKEPNNINSAHCLHMMDHFTFEGPHGKHIGMVFEVMGHNLLKVMKLYDWDGIPLPIARSLAKQTLIGLDYLHRICNVIHTDIKPENAILCPTEEILTGHLDTIPEKLKSSIKGPIQTSMFFSKEQNKINKRKKKNKSKKKSTKKANKKEESKDDNQILDENVQVKLCDFGNGCWIDHHFTSTIQTRQYRSPEIILGGEYDETCDLWSYACMVFELVTGDYLFNPKSGDDYAKEEDHVAFIIELIGHPKLSWLKDCKRYRKYFTTRGKMKRIFKHKIWKLEAVLKDKYWFKDEEAEQLADFLMQALQWKNEDRKSAQEMLRHPWLEMPANYDYRVDDSSEESNKSDDEEEDDDAESWVTMDSDEEAEGEEENDSDDGSNSSYDLW